MTIGSLDLSSIYSRLFHFWRWEYSNSWPHSTHANCRHILVSLIHVYKPHTHTIRGHEYWLLHNITHILYEIIRVEIHVSTQNWFYYCMCVTLTHTRTESNFSGIVPMKKFITTFYSVSVTFCCLQVTDVFGCNTFHVFLNLNLKVY